jgi:hypothetical protein
VKCDVCDEEFDTENQLMQHKAQMHAGGTGGAGMQGEGMADDDDLEEPDMPRAANE